MEKDVYDLARKRVKKKKGFYGHLSAFIAVSIFFFIMNIATWGESGEWWFFFPVLPWSIGLIIHYFSVFGLPGTDIMTRDWEEREIEREARRIRGYSKPMPDLEEDDDLELKELRRVKDERWADEDLV
jgi:hypothetical protein